MALPRSTENFNCITCSTENCRRRATAQLQHRELQERTARETARENCQLPEQRDQVFSFERARLLTAEARRKLQLQESRQLQRPFLGGLHPSLLSPEASGA
jgi:hypothetical protein